MDNILDNKNVSLDDFNPHAIAGKLATRMKKLRLSQNLTQESLSRKSGVSLGSLKRFENKHKISLEHLLQLALALNALNAFHDLFPEKDYTSIDEIISNSKSKHRKRARNG
ncbi:MAG: helix-turn-helix transcriptional regulator [Chlorobi bacterium]|nr:helix-turn-helix transcriptional regulator [Chlorobiota bacterium]